MDKNAEAKETKFLGAQVKEDTFWAFKRVVADNRQSMQEAIEEAVTLYIEHHKKEASHGILSVAKSS